MVWQNIIVFNYTAFLIIAYIVKGPQILAPLSPSISGTRGVFPKKKNYFQEQEIW